MFNICALKNFNKMKRVKLPIYCLFALLMLGFVACEEENGDNPDGEKKFTSLESPYLICAGRNPGGIVFDFEYNGDKGGANYTDTLSVDDFEYDILIKTIKGEKDDESLGGAPYIQLHENVEAVNYTAVDTDCKGITKYNSLSASNVKTYTFGSDDTSFDTSNLTIGDTGAPLMSALKTEYKKLVIGEKWKSTAKNSVDEDEIIWIIKTREGQLVKFIVTDFPADPAPTTTGYIAVTWDYLD